MDFGFDIACSSLSALVLEKKDEGDMSLIDD